MLLINATLVVVGFAIFAYAWVIVAVVLVAFLMWFWQITRDGN